MFPLNKKCHKIIGSQSGLSPQPNGRFYNSARTLRSVCLSPMLDKDELTNALLIINCDGDIHE